MANLLEFLDILDNPNNIENNKVNIVYGCSLSLKLVLKEYVKNKVNNSYSFKYFSHGNKYTVKDIISESLEGGFFSNKKLVFFTECEKLKNLDLVRVFKGSNPSNILFFDFNSSHKPKQLLELKDNDIDVRVFNFGDVSVDDSQFIGVVHRVLLHFLGTEISPSVVKTIIDLYDIDINLAIKDLVRLKIIKGIKKGDIILPGDILDNYEKSHNESDTLFHYFISKDIPNSLRSLDEKFDMEDRTSYYAFYFAEYLKVMLFHKFNNMKPKEMSYKFRLPYYLSNDIVQYAPIWTFKSIKEAINDSSDILYWYSKFNRSKIYGRSRFYTFLLKYLS